MANGQVVSCRVAAKPSRGAKHFIGVVPLQCHLRARPMLLTTSPSTPTLHFLTLLRCARRGRRLRLGPMLQFTMAPSDMCASPAHATLHNEFASLSSSPLPDIQELGAKKPRAQVLRSGSAAAPLPADASPIFTTASDLLRAARANDDRSPEAIDEPELPTARKVPAKSLRKSAKDPKAKKAPKRVAKKVIVLSSDKVTPEVARHGEPETNEPDNAADGKDVGGTPLKAKSRKTRKAPADPKHAVMGEEESGVAKPSAEATTKKRSKRETVSRHFLKESSTPGVPTNQEKTPRISTPEPTNLEQAVQRRMDWTPPRPDTLPLSITPFDSPLQISTSADGDTGAEETDVFRKLRDTYGHKAVDAAPPIAPQQKPATVLGKRKAIEMVTVNQSSKPAELSRVPSPAKVKAPRKKPRTITELAMAAYGPQVEPEEDLHKDDSVLDYFAVEGTEQVTSKNTSGKGTGKTKKATKSKKAPPKRPILLSPHSAMRQSARQDFVFGTSSQLAREQSPTFLRDLHEAMKASTIIEEGDPFASPVEGDQSKTKKPGKGLWSVSARDEDGEMVNVDIIDLVGSPEFPADDAILDPWTQLSPDLAGVETEIADSSLIELGSRPAPTNESKSPQPTLSNSPFSSTQRKITINAVAGGSPQHTDSLFPPVTDLLEEDEMPPPSNQQQTEEEVREAPSMATAGAQKPRPNYELFTDAKLAKEISRYGFKAVRTRSGMISLLDQCWRSQNKAPATAMAFSTSTLAASPKRKQAASSAAAPKASPAKKPRGRSKKTVVAEASERTPAAEEEAEPPKKKRGRPRKEAAAAVTAASSMPPPPKPRSRPSTPKRKKATAPRVSARVDTDGDSESDEGLSSPEQLFSPAGADVSISDDTEISLNLSPTAQHSTLFSHITKAVTSAPRSTDPENPSWHEKMLMYDPVILEDLAAWLNSGQLTRVGYDDEVAPTEVKKWCESRSICCLWRINLHGKERKRF